MLLRSWDIRPMRKRNAVANMPAVAKDEDGAIICCHRVCVAALPHGWHCFSTAMNTAQSYDFVAAVNPIYSTNHVDHIWNKVNQINKFMAVLCSLLEILNLKLGHLVWKQDRTLVWSPKGRWDWLTRPHNQVVLNSAFFVPARISLQ